MQKRATLLYPWVDRANARLKGLFGAEMLTPNLTRRRSLPLYRPRLSSDSLVLNEKWGWQCGVQQWGLGNMQPQQ
jgi:hypothetical protein